VNWPNTLPSIPAAMPSAAYTSAKPDTYTSDNPTARLRLPPAAPPM
jgi:hypothetical protein